MDQNKVLLVFRKVLRALAKGAITLLLCAGALLLWTWYLNRPPNYRISPPAVPKKNALDYFRRASKTRQYGYELSWVKANWQTLELHVLEPEAIEKRRQSNTQYGIKDENIEHIQHLHTIPELLKANQTALRLIREGLQHEFVFPLNPALDGQQYYRISQQIGSCQRLLDLNALYHLHAASPRITADALVDLIQFNTLTNYNSWYIRDTGFTHLHALANKLTVTDARIIVARLEDVCATRPSYAESLARTKPYQLSQITDILKNPESFRWNTNRWKFGLPAYHPSPPEDRPMLINQFYAWTVPNAKVPGIADRYLTRCIQAAKQPFSAHVAYPKPPSDCLNWGLFGWDEPVKEHLQWLLWEFQQDGLMLSLAIHGYRREHQRYPANLGELVADGWVKRLPVDPFTQKDTLCYRNKGKSFVLYSRGPDGKDNGGKPIGSFAFSYKGEPPSSIAERKHIVLVRSEGDVVYGVNKLGEVNSNFGRL